ncbi:hypothetical protein GCM10010149_88530 [Nonomuraea roseoviolacea subsp. roseoviolacea]|uniref:hypothetical protein n=1 Tax=Nonomuraea roseoviolacea TaxID=103837 RepID=UPI0031CEA228
MKRKDIKLDEFYYYEHRWELLYGNLVRFLDLSRFYDQKTDYRWQRPERIFSEAHERYKRPERWNSHEVGYAVVFIDKDTPENREAAAKLTVADMLDAGREQITDELRFGLVIALPKVLGQFDEVMAQKAEESQREARERRAKEERDAAKSAQFKALQSRFQDAAGIYMYERIDRTSWTLSGGSFGFKELEKLAATVEFVADLRRAVTEDATSDADLASKVGVMLGELDRKLGVESE